MKLTFKPTTDSLHVTHRGHVYRRRHLGVSEVITYRDKRSTRVVYSSTSKLDADRAWKEIVKE